MGGGAELPRQPGFPAGQRSASPARQCSMASWRQRGTERERERERERRARSSSAGTTTGGSPSPRLRWRRPARSTSCSSRRRPRADEPVVESTRSLSRSPVPTAGTWLGSNCQSSRTAPQTNDQGGSLIGEIALAHSAASIVTKNGLSVAASRVFYWALSLSYFGWKHA